MSIRHSMSCCSLLILLVLVISPCTADTWSMTNVQVLTGTGAQLSPSPTLPILTLEHANTWEYGDNYFFVDITHPFDPGTSFYAEWHPRFSASKISGRKIGAGFVGDVLLCSEINVAEDWRAFLLGVGFDLKVPGFDFFQLDLEARNDPSIRDAVAFQVNPSWSVPFAIADARLRFTGAINFIGGAGETAASIMAQPQILVDCGRMIGFDGRLFCGIEYSYWKNKYGLRGINEHYPQVMVEWVF